MMDEARGDVRPPRDRSSAMNEARGDARPPRDRSGATDEARGDVRPRRASFDEGEARPPKDRRSLSHVGGEVRTAGDAEAARRLANAMAVPTSAEAEELSRAHVHGFHSYPARMHPQTARRLIEGFSRPGDTVLDPFCGSGTVLVEARLAGRGAVGVDANPLAVRLARLKTVPTTEAQRARLIEAAREVQAFADERRKAKAGPTKRYAPADVGMFQTHVLLELDGLRAGLDALPDAATREALELVLSAILTKVSRRESDTSGRDVERRLAAGYPARLFVRKTEELCARLAEVAEPIGAGGRRAFVLEGDARELTGVADHSIALAVTSPPYPGNYDYLEHHAARLRWLRLPPGRFDRAEIGARRRLDPLGAREGIARWRDELGGVLHALRRVLVDDGAVVLLIADSVVAASPVYAVDLLRSLAEPNGFALAAVASQPRPHFHAATASAFARRPRAEHTVLLRAR
ncbi:modification methylase, putative [Minicystis rosea]|nr:modification methylase, putative [Minicystis rosea]